MSNSNNTTCNVTAEILLANISGDVVGYGILAAFFLTSGIAIAAVIFAYVSQSLDEGSLNYLDRRIIGIVRRVWYRFLPGCETSDLSSPYSQLAINEARRLRKDGIVEFILTLSDQQLVTGLAILIAGVMNLKHLTRFEFIAVHSLAWFSSTTHLATLDCLREYFNIHKVPRNARVIGIVCFLVLLVAAIVIRALIAMSGMEPYQPLYCAWPLHWSISERSNWYGPFNIVWQMSWLTVLTFVVFSYVIRIQDFYTGCRCPLYMPAWLYWKFTSFESAGVSYQRIYKRRKAALRLQRLLRFDKRNSFLRLLPHAYDESFLSIVPGIAFSFVYGLSQVAASRFGMKVRLPSNAVWGYGQIVSILLLCVPFIAAGETYSTYKKRHSQLSRNIRRLSDNETLESFDPYWFGELRSLSSRHSQQTEDRLSFQVVEPKYQACLIQMKKYFCKEIDNIKHSNSDDQETTNRKQELLTRYEIVRAYEDQINIMPSVIWFAISFSGAIIVAILLNAADFDKADRDARDRILFAIALLLGFLGVKLMSLALELFTILTVERHTTTENAEDHV